MSDFLAAAVDRHTDRINKWHVLIIVLIIAVFFSHNQWATLLHDNYVPSFANTLQRNS